MVNNYRIAYEESSRNTAHSFSPPEQQANLFTGGPLRILQVTPLYLPHIGGTEIHTAEVSQRLAAAGHHVTVLTTDINGRQPAEESKAGVRIYRVPAWPAHSDLYYAPEMARFILNGDWQILHCQGYHTLVPVVAMRAALKKQIPYFVTFHSGGHSSWLREKVRPIQRTLLRPLLAKAEALIGVSKWEAAFFQQHLQLPAEKFQVIPNGFSLPDLAGMQADRHAEKATETLILSVGRLEKYKGHQRLIEAMPYILSRRPGARLRIAGSGPYEANLRQAANQAGVAQHVQIEAVAAGDRQAMAALLLQSAVVVILSSYESQSIAAIEAAALNRPLLVADQTALSELVENGWAGAVAPTCTAEELAAAVLNQLDRPVLSSGRRLPTWDECAQKNLALYLAAHARKQ